MNASETTDERWCGDLVILGPSPHPAAGPRRMYAVRCQASPFAFIVTMRNTGAAYVRLVIHKWREEEDTRVW